MSKMETGSSTNTSASTRGTGRSGPRASLACMNCRQRKIKCRMSDTSSAACVSCRSLNLPCVVNKDGDRRKAGSRQHVAALQERLDYLEAYIASGQHGNDSSPTSERLPSIPIPDASNRMPSDPALYSTNPSIAQVSRAAPPSIIGRKSSASYNSGNSPSQADLGRLTPSSTDRDSTLLDLDEADGRLRFYGPTSQAHIHRPSVPVESDDWTTDDDGLSIDSLPLRTLLFNTYLKIQPHSFVIVDENLFLQGREGRQRSEYYSAFLEDALLASATRMSTSSGVRRLGPKYVERAKMAITSELERPNTATLQGFLLLSDFEATRGRDRLGYLYCGIGCRLVFDLGLHESCAELVAKGKLSAQEAMWRHTLFLGSFAYDKLWSLYTGRPGSIPNNILETSHSKALGSGWNGPATLDPWIRLFTDISEATDILNSTPPLDDASRERVISLDHRMHARSESLPMTLYLDKDRISDLPPPAYSLHIQFHGIRIILHRLLYKSANHQLVESPSDADHRAYSIERSRAIMYENAIQISQLVTTYQQIFGVEQIIAIMLDNSYVASVVLISHLLRALQHDHTGAAVERDMSRLRALADLLSKAQKHYPVTVRMRFSLSSHVENTPMAGMFGTFSSSTHEQKNSGVTELQPTSNGQPTLTDEQQGEMFQDLNGGGQLRPDMAIFGEWVGGEKGQSIFQEMDMQNMMSWALSPSSTRTDLGF